MINRSPVKILYCLVLFILYVSLAACVPSPTATPPRQTPFPTLPVEDGTPTLELVTTPAAGTLAATTEPTSIATTAPLSNSALAEDTLPPVVQLTVQDPELPVSLGQSVPLNVLSADNTAITRLELYDNNVFSAEAPVIVSSPVYSNQFIWKADTLGKHTLRAIAYDAAGNAADPAQIELTVINNNRAPGVQITAPSGIKDAELGAPMLIQGVATDDVAVTRIELIVDNELVTFLKPERAGGITPYAVAIPWTPTTTGSHNILLRAYDNQNQSDDSLRYTIRVFDNQSPVVTASSDAITFSLGDALLVNALALSNNGIGRMELYVDDRLADSANSSAPSEQTSFQTALAAADLASGTHSFFVRAYDIKGASTDTPHTTIQVQAGAPQVIRETPASVGTRTPLPPKPSATPELNIPAAPSIELLLTNSPVILPNVAKIQITARGSSELDHIELWVRAPGETGAALITEENVKGATEKTLTYEWNAPHAGVVEMYARVSDNLNQSRVSVPLRFSVQPPPAPTRVPTTFNFAQTWYADSPASRFEVTFTQIGRALRGTFIEKRADGKTIQGRIVSGAVNDKTAVFGVDFTTASQPLHTFAFDCTFNPRPPVLTCNYTTENNERGSAVFQPLAP